MAVTSTALFPDKASAIAIARRDILAMAATSTLPAMNLNDDYIWDKLVAAEADLQRRLRVKFRPYAYFTYEPTADEIAALNGMPWLEDTPYDFDPEWMTGERWGFMKLNNVPIISVSLIKFRYPSQNSYVMEFSPDWIKLDKQTGQVRIVPNTTSAPFIFGNLMFNMMASGRVLPHTVDIKYVAGLQNVQDDWPDIVDLAKKLAVLKLLGDSFPAQSGSISADGLSESNSMDLSKHYETIDHIINGSNGNGGLMAAIHGIRLNIL